MVDRRHLPEQGRDVRDLITRCSPGRQPSLFRCCCPTTPMPGTSTRAGWHPRWQPLAKSLSRPASESPTRAVALAVADVAAGHVPFYFGNMNSALQKARAGKVRALAVTSPQRARGFPARRDGEMGRSREGCEHQDRVVASGNLSAACALNRMPVRHHVLGSFVHRMEDGVLGSKRTIPFWRPKRRLLELARALAPHQQTQPVPIMTARALASTRARSRIDAEGRKKTRFSEY
jgi:Tripartite tricarboxylate transporter family receptor